MPCCPKCESSLASITALWLHLSLVHRAENNSQFRCRERDCFRVCINWNSFRRHLLNTHNCQVIVAEPSSVSDVPEVPNYENCTSFCEENDSSDFIHDDSSDLIHDDNTFDIRNSLSQLILQFVAKLYANHKLPRSFIQDIFLDVRELLHEMVACMKKKIRNEINKADSSACIFEIVESVLDSFLEPFNRLSTENRRFEAFQASKYFVPIESYIIGDRLDNIVQKGIMVKKIVLVEAKFLPMRNVLQKVFSLPGVFSEVQSYVQKLEHDEVLENFVQSRLWKEKVKNYFQGRTVFPLFLYFDDFEMCNPLGSRCGT